MQRLVCFRHLTRASATCQNLFVLQLQLGLLQISTPVGNCEANTQASPRFFEQAYTAIKIRLLIQLTLETSILYSQIIAKRTRCGGGQEWLLRPDLLLVVAKQSLFEECLRLHQPRTCHMGPDWPGNCKKIGKLVREIGLAFFINAHPNG